MDTVDFWAIGTRMWVLPIAPSKCTCGQGPGTFECNLFSLTISHILLEFLFVFCFVNVSELDSLRRNFKWENTSIKLPCRWTCGMFSWLRIAVGGASSLQVGLLGPNDSSPNVKSQSSISGANYRSIFILQTWVWTTPFQQPPSWWVQSVAVSPRNVITFKGETP